MPTYEYACNTCGHRFDVRQSFNDQPISDCPECGATVRRVLYPAGVIFKGSGWYKTDSRPASHSDDKTSTTSSNGASASKPADTTETSTPAKTDTNSGKKDTVSTAADD
jgi:putative FmdB family regulatory protein